MKEEHGKKLDPNDPAVPAKPDKPDKPTALSDEDLDAVAGGSTGGGTIVIDPGTINGNLLGGPPGGPTPSSKAEMFGKNKKN